MTNRIVLREYKDDNHLIYYLSCLCRAEDTLSIGLEKRGALWSTKICHYHTEKIAQNTGCPWTCGNWVLPSLWKERENPGYQLLFLLNYNSGSHKKEMKILLLTIKENYVWIKGLNSGYSCNFLLLQKNCLVIGVTKVYFYTVRYEDTQGSPT